MAKKSLNRLRVACLQINSVADPQKNLAWIRRELTKIFPRKPDLICLPETFLSRSGPADQERLASDLFNQTLREFQLTARSRGTAFLLGSLLEKSPKKEKVYNTSLLISKEGRVIARYRKIHLYDNQLKGARVQESRHVLPGADIVCADLSGLRVGLSVCYDLRFPELFRSLSAKGCRMIFVPANFTEKTGKAHWEILLRARAIENQAFVVAPAQVGVHPHNRIRSFGESLIIDPWGRVLARGERKKPGFILADLDLSAQATLRKTFPVLKHRKIHNLR